MKSIATKALGRFPERITGDPTKITIYEEDFQGRKRYVVVYYDAASHRVRKRCPDYEKARAHAESVKKLIRSGGWDALVLRGQQRHSYERACQLVESYHLPIDQVAREWREAKEILGGGDVTEAARFAAQRQAQNVVLKPTPEIVTEYLEVMERAGNSDSYLKSLRRRLRLFATAFSGPLALVTTKDINEFAASLPGQNRYKNNVIQDVGTMCSFARAHDYVHKDFEAVRRATRYVVETRDPEVITPEDLERMLNEANPQLQLALALTAFAGIRGSEVTRLDWKDINFDLGCIQMRAMSTKTKTRRTPPIPENLRVWLMRYRKDSGPVITYRNVYNHYGKVAKRAGVLWTRNGLRHGFVSYRVAQARNVNEVSLEAGHTPSMLMSHYYKVVSPAAAAAWFSIYPPDSGAISGLPST